MKAFCLYGSPDVQKMSEADMVRRVQWLVPEQYATRLIEKCRKTLPDGDEYCEIVVRPTTEQEKKDFAAAENGNTSIRH